LSVSADEFKSVMAQVAATVTVVTTRIDDAPVGLTVSAFLSVSADPAIVLVCVDKATASLQAMLEADGFTVNIMPEGTEEAAMLFATHGADKFGPTSWKEPSTPTAGPVLASAFASLECATIDRVEVGDHWVLYGQVVHAETADSDAAPLVWHGRGFAKLQ